jgi:hypothetical protein
VRFATIAASAPPRLPQSAATEPPPGAGESVESSSAKPREVIAMSGRSTSWMRYSMILSAGSNGVISFRPIDWIAMRTISLSGWPGEPPCFS